MRFAREEDSQEIYELYKKNRKIFPNNCIQLGDIPISSFINLIMELKKRINFLSTEQKIDIFYSKQVLH